MTHAIIGFGAIGQALARRFARAGLEVQVASRRGPDELAATTGGIGPTVTPVPLAEGGALVQALGDAWVPLIFHDLVKVAR